MALGKFADTGDEADQRLAAYAIRAVIYAATEAVRDETLALCVWWLTRMPDEGFSPRIAPDD